LIDKRPHTLAKIEQNMTKDMLNLVPGATITDKASNFWIKPDDEEKLLAD
jgi:hypothetical protein